jgi:hypothetical protein
MNIAIVIATKDRPIELVKLLSSLAKSRDYFSTVIIVSSGLRIDGIINDFETKLNLKHFHSEIAGQNRQKKIALSLLDFAAEWVMFLDDDMSLPLETFDVLVSQYLNNPIYNKVVGFGLKINGLTFTDKSSALKLFLKMTGLHSDKSGTILPSGHAQSYQESQVDIEVEWLNGISIWKRDVLKFYEANSFDISYSAYEDVIFSYSVSRKHPLVFASKAMIDSQDKVQTENLNLQQFKAAAYMRNIFVSDFNNLSKMRFIIAQFFRSLSYIYRGSSTEATSVKIRASFGLWKDLLFSAIFRKDSRKILERAYD